MNHAVRRILSKVEFLKCVHIASWEVLSRSVDQREVEYHRRSSRNSSFAKAIIESLEQKWPGDIETKDTPGGEEMICTLYALPRSKMVELLEEAYNQGALDYGQRSRDMTFGATL